MSKLLINEHPLQILPALATAIGLNEAIFLQQLHYWLEIAKSPKSSTGKYKDDRWWVYNSVREWQETNFPFWSVATIKRVITSLHKKGLIWARTDLNKKKFDKTKWYTINYETLEGANRMGQDDPTSRSDCPNEGVNLNQPIPETTAEITTEKRKEEEKIPKNGKPEPDYLADVVAAAKQGISEESAPHPIDQYFAHTDEFLKAYEQAEFYLGFVEKGIITDLSNEDNASLEIWKRAIEGAVKNWSGNNKRPPLQRVIEVYRCDGDYGKFADKKWRKDGMKPKRKYKWIPEPQGEQGDD